MALSHISRAVGQAQLQGLHPLATHEIGTIVISVTEQETGGTEQLCNLPKAHS